MRKSLVLVVCAAVLPVSTAAGGSALDACKLVSSKQASSLGVKKACVGKTTPGLSGVISWGNWGSPGSDRAALALTVSTFKSTSSPVYQENLKLMKVLPGHPKQVRGIGSLAYESGGDGGGLASIHFVKGRRIVGFSWYSKKPETSLKAFNAIAKGIASQI